MNNIKVLVTKDFLTHVPNPNCGIFWPLFKVRFGDPDMISNLFQIINVKSKSQTCIHSIDGQYLINNVLRKIQQLFASLTGSEGLFLLFAEFSRNSRLIMIGKFLYYLYNCQRTAILTSAELRANSQKSVQQKVQILI